MEDCIEPAMGPGHNESSPASRSVAGRHQDRGGGAAGDCGCGSSGERPPTADPPTGGNATSVHGGRDDLPQCAVKLVGEPGQHRRRTRRRRRHRPVHPDPARRVDAARDHRQARGPADRPRPSGQPVEEARPDRRRRRLRRPDRRRVGAHKQLLQRPLVVTADMAIIGRPKERVTALLSALA